MLQLYVFDLKKRTKEGRLKLMCSVSIKIHKTKKETETSQHVVCCHFTIMKITWHQKLSFASTVTNRWLIAAVLSYFNYSSNSMSLKLLTLSCLSESCSVLHSKQTAVGFLLPSFFNNSNIFSCSLSLTLLFNQERTI